VTWKNLLILTVFLAIIYNLGAALFYMVTNRSAEGRTVRSLTWRIGLSVGLIALVILGILAGIIQPHGVRVGH
jgi:DMSO/TMAO reductase YedYZ heme-binding membrane subunit